MPKTNRNFDYKAYFGGKSPEDVYEEYKELVKEYIHTAKSIEYVSNTINVYRSQLYNIINNQRIPEEERDEREKHYKELIAGRTRDINEMKKLMKDSYVRANLMEKYVRKSGMNEVFVDLGSLTKDEYLSESHAGEIADVIWAPSKEFLRLARPFFDVNNESDSIAYNANRAESGRVMPANLRFSNTEGELMVTAHQGRHRNYGNIYNRGIEAKFPTVLLEKPEGSLPRNNAAWKRAKPEGDPKTAHTLQSEVKEIEHYLPSVVETLRTKADRGDMTSRHMNPKKKETRKKMSRNYHGFSPRKDYREGVNADHMSFLDKSDFVMTFDEFLAFVKANYLEEITLVNEIQKSYYEYEDSKN